MKPSNCKLETYFMIHDIKNVRKSTNRIKKMLNVIYEKANL